MIVFSMPREIVANPFHQTDSVLLLGVSDTELAREKVQAGLEAFKGVMQEHLHQAVLIQPVPTVKAEGFNSVWVPIFAMFPRPVIGVHDKWLVCASSDEAVNKYIATAAGKAPCITTTARFKAEGIRPSGPVHSVSFTDERYTAKAMAEGFTIAGTFMHAMPRQKEMLPMMAMFRVLAKLQPVFEEIDFLSSSATATTFDGKCWMTEGVLTCRQPATKKVEFRHQAKAERRRSPH
jgi:hypothetical protein